MATLSEEMKVFGMSGRPNLERADSRKSVLLEVAYKLFANQVYALSLRLLASERDAEVVTVDVFAKFNQELTRKWNESRVLERLRELAIDEALRRLGRSHITSHDWQAATNSSPTVMSMKAGQKEPRSSSHLPHPPLDLATIDRLIKTMPDELRVAFVLHDMEGFDNQTLAKLLRLDEARTRRLTTRARLVLRRLWLSQTEESV